MHAMVLTRHSAESAQSAPTFDSSEDERLLARIASGDRRAEELFYRRHAHAVIGTVHRLLRDRNDAEEVVQETFLEVFGKLATLRDAKAARAWILRIAVRKVHRRFRTKKLLRVFGFRSGDDDGSFLDVAATDLSPDGRLELARFDEVLGRLPASDRIAWMLRFVEDEKLEDVARLCDCSLATAKRRIAAAEAAIQLHIEQRGGVR